MSNFTIELLQAAQIEGVGVSMFSDELPDIGHTLVIDNVGRFRVLDVEHRAQRMSDTMFAARLVVIVEPAP